ncbi:Pathogenesis-related protein 1B [Vitis vinifera]|uniref:Pathogenesis-related protein 1B n=1 Tax=Vitis vinifera TaxID=29760 RepID=A0A438DW61_VITVI|nr:Pathogenesis-related protein 1B [Vitis vinifera]
MPMSKAPIIAVVIILASLLLDAVWAQEPAPTNGTAAKRKLSLGSMAREFVLAHNVVRAHYQETAFQMGQGPSPVRATLRLEAHVVESWAKEHKYYNKDTNQCTQGQMCGHYTQIVWRDSVRLGCARVNCLNGGMYAICSYDPPGNYINENPFDSKWNSDWGDEPEPDSSTTPPTSIDPPSPPSPPAAQPSQT